MKDRNSLLTTVDQARVGGVRKLEMDRSNNSSHINRIEVWYRRITTIGKARDILFHSGARCINEHKVVVWLPAGMPISHSRSEILLTTG